jgi:regulator of RNase E activity RraA
MTDDTTLFATIRGKLFTAVLGDVMDTAGMRQQFLPPEIRPIGPAAILVGRAMPVQIEDVEGEHPDPFGVMFRALDDLKPGEIYLTTGGSPNYALWGGLMSGRAMKLGSPGAVLDGYHRDTTEILHLGYPLFSRGAYAQDQRFRGRSTDFRCAVTFANGTRVEPGDVIVGDIDGVLAIPHGNAADIVQAALAKVEGESGVRRMIEAGETTESIFARTGIM